MVRLGLIFVAAALFAVQAIATPAFAGADQPAYVPPPDWAKLQPAPKDVPAPKNAPAQVLLINRQTRLSPQGDDFFVEDATRILSPQGLASVGTIALVWDPDTEALAIHALKIIRGDTTIDVLAGGKKFTVLHRESNLELSMLDGRLTATIEPEGLQVGDIVYLSYTTTRRDPALAGHSAAIDQLRHSGIAAHVVMRTLWPAGAPVRYRVTDAMPAPTVTKSAAGGEVTSDLHDVEMPKPPLMAPARFQELGVIEFSDFDGWPALSRLMYPLYAKAETLAATSPLKAEISKIAALSPDPKVRALAAWRLVEDQTRYVFLGMNDGGLVPADADATWSRRFGDCKGKTVLLLALLHGLGIAAEPTLVNTKAGDGMDQRLPSAGWFDHVMVRAEIAGKTYWLDGTRLGDRVLDDQNVPRFGWALPLSKDGGELIKLAPQPRARPDAEDVMAIDASKGADAPSPTRLEEHYRGDYAAGLRANLASVPRDDFERKLRENWTKVYPWFDVDTVTIAEEGDGGDAKIIAEGTSRLEWNQAGDGSRVYRVPGTAMGQDVSFKRQPGPQIDAPYLVGYPFYATYTRRITLPSDGDFTLIGVDVDQTIAGQTLTRCSRIENGVLVIESSERAIQPEFPSSEADAAGVALRELARKDVAIDYRVRPAGAIAPTPQKAASLDTDLAAAAKGDAGAEARVGQAYLRGAGVPYDRDAGTSWLRKSAAAGNREGEGALGALLISGTPGDAQAAEGANLLQRAAVAGDPKAEGTLGWLYLVGRGVPKDDGQAVAWLQKAAAANDPSGEFFLSTLYFSGRGVLRDVTLGADLMRKAADQGLPPAEAGLAASYAFGAGVAKDPVQAAAWARKAADQGDARGQLLLGRAYELGEGVPKDPTQAVTLYRTASDRGAAAGQLQLSRVYRDGVGGVAKDEAQALVLLRKAADQDYAEAETQLAVDYRRGALGLTRNFVTARYWLEKAAAQNEPGAEAELGLMAQLGEGGQRDLPQAAAWYLKAAVQNDAVAVMNLGVLYEGGLGVPRDYAKAQAWYQQAVSLGQVRAGANLGALYLFGRGVPEDDVKAGALIREAAIRGDSRGEYLLGLIYERGKGVPADEAQAVTWYAKAAAQGDLMAAAGLGLHYVEGSGVKADPTQAAHWLTLAAQGGVPAGEYDLGQLYERGVGVPKDTQQAIHWYTLAAQHGVAAARAKIAQLGGPDVPAPPPLNIAPVAKPQ